MIDSGLARVRRYSPRQEDRPAAHRRPISAGGGALQRARDAADGWRAAFAIRLYDAGGVQHPPGVHDAGDPAHVARVGDPAHVAALELGPIQEFSFIEPPTPRQIEDGYRLLFELGAIDESRTLTEMGKELARLPVDPRIGRLLLAAREFHCLSEMVILAAALSIQDPRDRPQALREQSDRAHEEFRDESSDFLQLLNLWKFFDEQFIHKKSNRKLYEYLPRAFPLVRAHARVARPGRPASRDGRGAEDPRQPRRRPHL